LTENFAAERLRLSANGTCVYDVPPVALFDQKLLLAFPFWDETRGYFSDAIRGLFPYTTVLAPEGVRLETGDWTTLEQFSALARGKRGYFLKYAGADVARNWGSRAVFRLDTETSEACLARLRAAVEHNAKPRRQASGASCGCSIGPRADQYLATTGESQRKFRLTLTRWMFCRILTSTVSAPKGGPGSITNE
jgi:hypothetical protein